MIIKYLQHNIKNMIDYTIFYYFYVQLNYKYNG